MSHTQKESCSTCESAMSHTCISHVAHMNESCHTQECVVSHVTWVVSRARMGHITHIGYLLHTKVAWHSVFGVRISHATHRNESSHTRKWVMYSVFESIISVFESIRHSVFGVAWHSVFESIMQNVIKKYEWVMSYQDVPHMNESCPTYEWVMSYIWMSHVEHMDESCPTYESVMQHIGMSQVTHVNESCHKYRVPVARKRRTVQRVWCTNESCNT